jgi:eukaryotic-like serine/threonine-protein kinase
LGRVLPENVLTLRDQLQKSLGPSYTIERELGGGGMSRVFVAEETRFGRRVVIKVLMPELVQGMSAERFEREIKLAAQLQQANIVSVIGAGESEGLPYYTMPYVDGESLRTRLSRGSMSIGEAVSTLRDVTRALVYAHAKGVVHRDIKPENILLAGGVAVVTDFGIAKALSASKTDAPGGTLTVVGTSLGTPAYMAPEQGVGDQVDERADIYALGVVAYEMLAGSHPFGGRTTAQQYITAHLAEKPVDIVKKRADTPPLLAETVMQALEKEPKARPQSAVEILRTLDDPALTTGSGTKRVRSVSSPGGSRGGRRVVAVIAALALLGAAAFALRGKFPVAGKSASEAADSTRSAVKTIAVIPFTNTGGKSEDEYFSDGMTDELAHALSRIPDVQVAGRTSSYLFKGKQASAQEIGKALNVGAVVEGSVRRAGDRLRVIAQLTNAANGLVIWSDTYESTAQDVFQVQDQFTKAIITAISPTLRGQPAVAAATEQQGTADPAAYDAYLRGKFFLAKRNANALDSAINYFQTAIARDPKFARAFAGLAQTYVVYRFYTATNQDSLGRIAASRALAIDSTVADAHIALAYSASNAGRFPEADRHFGAAERLEPSNFLLYLWRSSSYQHRALPERVMADLQKAVALDPLSVVAAGNLGGEYVNQRKFAESRRQLRKAMQIDSTSWPGTWSFLTAAYIWSGFPDSAVYAAERAMQIGDRSPQRIRGAITAYAAAGRWADVDRMRARLRGTDKVLGDVQEYLLITGQHEPILRFMEMASAQAVVARRGPYCHPSNDRISREPRYIAAMQKHGLPLCPLSSPWPFPERKDGKK